MRNLVTDCAYLYFMVPHPLREDIPSAAKYHTRRQITETAPWGDRIQLWTKTFTDYERGLEEAGFSCGWLRTTGEGLKVEDGYLNTDESVRDMIRRLKAGTYYGQIPRHLRLWMVASPIRNYRK